jgi:hypothetical protein
MLKEILWAGDIAPIEGSRSRVPEKERRGGGSGDTLLSVASQEWCGADLCCGLRVVKNVLYDVLAFSFRLSYDSSRKIISRYSLRDN